MKTIFGILLILLLVSCANFSLSEPELYSLSGGAGGAIMGHTLSPNEESKGINALVFGAIGLGTGYFFHKFFRPKTSEILAPSLQEKELQSTKEIILPATTQKLPDFVKKRLTPIVIETFEEKSNVNESGELSEPHRVWRIKRSPQLIPNRTKDSTN